MCPSLAAFLQVKDRWGLHTLGRVCLCVRPSIGPSVLAFSGFPTRSCLLISSLGPGPSLFILFHSFPPLSSCCPDTKPRIGCPGPCAEWVSVPACRLPQCLPALSPVPISLVWVAWTCSYAQGWGQRWGSRFGGYDGVWPQQEPRHAGQETAGSLVGQKPKMWECQYLSSRCSPARNKLCDLEQSTWSYAEAQSLAPHSRLKESESAF